MATNVSRDEEKEKAKDDEKAKAIAAWKNKNEAAKKGEILREIQKLKVQIQAMEREKCTHLYSKRSDFRDEFSQIEELEDKQNNERKTELVERLKMIMEEIEGTINAFKEQQRKHYESMLLEERTGWLEIQALEKKFDSWSQLGAAVDDSSRARSAPHKPLATDRDITKDLPPEVAAFEKFVEQTGGVRGGWDEYDHQTFLKFRQRYQGKPVFLQHVLPALPTRTEEEIHDHEDWYQEYLFLNETKKQAIRKWREKKEEEKEEILSKATEEPEETPDERQECLRQIIEQEKLERKSKLNSYKVQKELERAQKEERQLREQLNQQQRQQEWKQKQEEMHQKVLEHKRQREEEEAFQREQKAQWEAEERERQRQVSAREIVKFRQRDEASLQQKKEKERENELAARERERRLEMLKSQVEVEVERDPSRLLQPTAGVRNRVKDKSTAGGQVLPNMMPHRAVPAWRQGP
ncbi:coiled-coil domain-containing protein 112-like isoform X2 [Dreissena polymorpha]|uniref:coiled-coil domain-containing protein 112-like isoform X2 n=2 Tax=Dreissena polymorpha TaxID=45954 RepID=UPI0022645811|nr:coiled-coil domain-containing protein 112-like isoform X2 [Dreissena polymorpha]